MVAVDLGTGLLPRVSAKSCLRNSTLRMVELDETWAQHPLSAIMRDYAALPVPAWLLIDHLVSQASTESQRDPSGSEKVRVLIPQLHAGCLYNTLQLQHTSDTGSAVILNGQRKGVLIQEVTTRDDSQVEPRTVPIQDKIILTDRLSRCGLSKIEVTSFASLKATPTLAGVEDVIRGTARMPGVTYAMLVSDMRGVKRAVDCDVDELNLAMSVSETHDPANPRMMSGRLFQQAAQAAVTFRPSRMSPSLSLLCALDCPMEGQIPTDITLIWAAWVVEAGVGGVTLCGTTSMAWPSQMFILYSAFRLALPQTMLTVHLHNTCDTTLADVLAVLQVGVDRFDGMLDGLGGCPYAPGASGNVCTEDMVYMLELPNYDTGTDLGVLPEASRLLPDLIGHDINDQITKAGCTHDLHPTPDYAETARQYALSKAPA